MSQPATAAQAGPSGLAARAPLADRVVRDPVLLAFAKSVGGVTDGPVAVEGGRTQWEAGGASEAGTRLVAAPTGVVAFEPAEMTVQVRAGTSLANLDDILAAAGQRVALEGFSLGATVGGVLSVGRSGMTRLGHGPVRDTLLQARYVSAEGLLVTAGGPTVKNVTGFDLCRLLVGSLGTLGLLGEVILRTRPRPEVSCWLAGPADPFALRDALYRPVALLWNGTQVWLCLEGYQGDVDQQAMVAGGHGLVPVAGPPPLPAGRTSLDPGLLSALDPAVLAAQGLVAEIGVGILHGIGPGSPVLVTLGLDAEAHNKPRPPTGVGAGATIVSAHRREGGPALDELNARVKSLFDPTGRLNPGRRPLDGRRATIGVNAS